MHLSAPTPTSTKAATSRAPKTRQRVFSWPDVLRCLQEHDNLRESLLARYRARGFTPDDFARSLDAQACVARELTRGEDWLELTRPQFDRHAIRALRRSLEGDR